MNLKPYFNDTNHVVFLGGVMIPAGDTRLVDVRLLPEPVMAAVSMPEGAAALDLETLLQGTVAEVMLVLPDLSREEVEQLGELEQMGQARRGILGPVADLLLTSANTDIGGNLDEEVKQDQAATDNGE